MLEFVPRVAALVLGLSGPTGVLADWPKAAVVVAETLDVFDQPDLRSVASGRLSRGDHVVVRAVAPGGWLTIAPPALAFRWIDQAAIRAGPSPTEGHVETARAQVRSGHPGARLPGPPRGILARGTPVLLLDRPPLVLGRGSSARTWRAIAPAPEESWYIRAEGVEWAALPPPAPPSRPEPTPEAKAAFLAETPPEPPSPAIAAAIAPIEASHRDILRAPIALWHLEPIRARYQALAKQATDAPSAKAIRARLDLVDRHAEAAQAARTIESILERSRLRDRKLALYLRRVAQVELPHERPYDAQGLIQASSRKVDGQKVFALIGPDGTTQAYLDLPAGLDPAPLLARRVGVRGSVHYDENLRALLIAVRDLDPLNDDDR